MFSLNEDYTKYPREPRNIGDTIRGKIYKRIHDEDETMFLIHPLDSNHKGLVKVPQHPFAFYETFFGELVKGDIIEVSLILIEEDGKEPKESILCKAPIKNPELKLNDPY